MTIISLWINCFRFTIYFTVAFGSLDIAIGFGVVLVTEMVN